MNVAILHGDSAPLPGDGLLVDLAIDTVLRNLGVDTLVTLVASDSRTFGFRKSAFEHIYLTKENIIKGVVR